MTNTCYNQEAFEKAAECFKVLAHPGRLHMLALLLQGRYTVKALAAECQCPQNVASEQLRLMQRYGMLKSEREGRCVYYLIAEPCLQKVMECVLKK
ncbi:metalloregulator ArsR/SmtB family transcription factor [Lentisphaerota bacterium ZTH]|nr:helix-turn-helix transcriptional regulator [Lentisphaerota bacterium]WET05564.1 metalloregulator ArsR/SmtB family transcription factor [Lentisphaerota bacterium ZTH]